MIVTDAFVPNPKTAAGRKDGGEETSINWEDDSEAEAFTLADKGNAGYGAARISTAQITEIAKKAAEVATTLSCERKPEARNKYHGNIVYSAKMPKPVRKMLAAGLALNSTFVSPS